MLRKALLCLLLFAPSIAWAADPPTLSVVIGQDGNAVIVPVFPGREKGASKFRWDQPVISEGAVSARLLWVSDAGWPEVSLYKIPLNVEWTGALPGPVPPVPPTPPIPPTPPTPPKPPVVASALIIVTGQQAPKETPWKAADVVSFLSARSITPHEYSTTSVNDSAFTDVVALKWIGKSANPDNAYPYFFLTDASGGVMVEGVMPRTAPELIAAMSKVCGPAPPSNCPDGTCPTKGGAQ